MKNWMNNFTILYERTSIISLTDKPFEEEQRQDLKKEIQSLS